MKILQLSCHFRPNVGGVETHLNDLVEGLLNRDIKVVVLTYRPLTTNTSWSLFEVGNNLKIIRTPWFPGYFYKLIKNPFIEFLYLLPGLFILTPLIILIENPDVVHSHGLVAGFIGIFWGKIFGKKVIISTHSLYNFPKTGIYRSFAKDVFKRADKILTLSKQSKNEILDLGIEEKNINVFTYWIDLKSFRPRKNKKEERYKFGWKKKFIVFFVGRLVEEKGILVLLNAARKWNKNIGLVIAGVGPLEGEINRQRVINKNIIFLGKVENKVLPNYYYTADVVIIPSIHEEGFGRVILESLACGTPVIASNRGAISEAMNNSVGVLIDISVKNIATTVNNFYYNPDDLLKLSKNAVNYARLKYSDKNINTIIKAYGTS